MKHINETHGRIYSTRRERTQPGYLKEAAIGFVVSGLLAALALALLL